MREAPLTQNYYDESSATFIRTLFHRHVYGTAFDDGFTVSWERLAEGLRKRWMQAVTDLFALVKAERADDEIASYIGLNVSTHVLDMHRLVEDVRGAYALNTTVVDFIDWFRGRTPAPRLS
jgi:hypothetical protein